MDYFVNETGMLCKATDQSLTHYGIKGMKWGVRRYQNEDGSLTNTGRKRYSDDVVIDKGTEIHRISMIDNETHTGHAYAAYKEQDVKKYAQALNSFMDVYDMKYTALENIVSPSKQKRVDTFIQMHNDSAEVRRSAAEAKASIMKYIPGVVKHYEKKYSNLADADQKTKDSAYDAFAYALVYDKKLRERYFSTLQKQGYNAVIDDADVGRGMNTESPLIIFDRQRSLSEAEITKIPAK